MQLRQLASTAAASNTACSQQRLRQIVPRRSSGSKGGATAAAAAAMTPSPRAARAATTVASAAAPAAAATTTTPPPLGAPLGAAYDAQANMPDWHKGRRAGVILHPTSLPGGRAGIGELGVEAFAFLDWLADAGMTVWQVLPLVPPDPEYFSPYSGLDANCGNPLLISLDALATEGLLTAADVAGGAVATTGSGSSDGDVDFAAAAAYKNPLLLKAARALLADARFAALRDALARFRADNAWIEESALFDALRRRPELEGKEWWLWPEPLRLRDAKAIAEARAKHAREIDEFVAVQFLFDRQWRAVKAYANARGISVVGDMPIYVGGQSADVWANRHLFELDPQTCEPLEVSGVPPDAFSATGQLWGSPLYRWPAHAEEGYAWWAARLARAFSLYDETRVDHFRAFAGYWAVGAGEETAMNGSWRQGPGAALFDAVRARLGAVPIMAEDLGVITKDVVALREQIGAPGMVVLQFAWGGGPANVHLPHMHYENSFVYPGTHDNETAVGWWRGSATPTDKAYLTAYLNTDGSDVAWDFIRASMASVGRTTVVMMQDVMRLDNSARMNTPGRAEGNWAWRVPGGGGGAAWRALAGEAAALRQMAHDYGRLPRGARLGHV